MKSQIIIIVSLFIMLFCSTSHEINYEQARNTLKTDYFLRDYEHGCIQGEKYIKTFPDSLELRAWYEINRLGTYFHVVNEVLDIGREIAQLAPQSPWGYFIIVEAYSELPQITIGYPGAAYRFRKEAAEASEIMIKLAPNNPDIIWMRAKALSITGNFEDANRFIDEHISKVTHPAELIVLKANIEKSQNSRFNPNPKRKQMADSLFHDAIHMDSACINAYWGLQTYDTSYKKILKQAMKFSPYSTDLLMIYCRITARQKKLSKDEKIKDIEDIFKPILSERGSYPWTLYVVYETYSDHGLAIPEKENEYGEYILKNHPYSVTAEWVRIFRIRDLRRKLFEQKVNNWQQSSEYRNMLLEYINLPQHLFKGLLGETYSNLFDSYKDDSTISNKTLLEVSQKMCAYTEGINDRYYVEVANTLCKRTTYFKESEQLARTGLTRFKAYIRKQFPEEFTEEEFEKQVGWSLSPLYDAIGWAQFKMDNFEDAKYNLLHAHELNPKEMTNLYHLGQFFEQHHEFESAKAYYTDGINLQRPGDNPNEAALKELLLKTEGNIAYYEEQSDADAEKRREEILLTRITDPKAADHFNLKSIGNRMVSLNDIKGKVTVINMWGLWCGWCLNELPEFQLLHEKYKNDTDVLILTINNDQNQEEVPVWMKKKEFDFTVLLDDGYLKKVGIYSYPTTWFLDRNSKITYIQEGWTKKLVEEFSWRIESLR